MGVSRTPPSHKHGGSVSDHKTPLHLHHTTTNTMSDAEVKNGVAAEAPTTEELKAQKRSAEDDEVDHKKQKTENGSNGATAEEGEEEEDAEEEEDIDVRKRRARVRRTRENKPMRI